ncbi:MAG: hypothetical protein KJ607_00610 [Bacteroidetes bacterium]|nr:hypothetical protein [Bacteroidota bacterium]
MMKIKTGFVIVLIFITLSGFTQQKDTVNKAEISAGTDIMSRYVWRGADFGASPGLQPSLSFKYGGLKIGAWGAYSIIGGYAETDLYAAYSYKWLTLTVTDYFCPYEQHPNIAAGNNNYFDYGKNTRHVFEAALGYTGPEKFPVSILVGVYVYGADKLPGDSTKNNYSTYFELKYSGSLNEMKYDLFLGGTDKNGSFGNGAGIINAGITVYKEIVITEKYSLPLQLSLITNPQKENIFFVAGFSF